MIGIINILELYSQGNYSTWFWLLITDCTLHFIILPVVIIFCGFHARKYEWSSFKRHLASGLTHEESRIRARNDYRSGEKITLTSKFFDWLFLIYIKRNTH